MVVYLLFCLVILFSFLTLGFWNLWMNARDELFEVKIDLENKEFHIKCIKQTRKALFESYSNLLECSAIAANGSITPEIRKKISRIHMNELRNFHIFEM